MINKNNKENNLEIYNESIDGVNDSLGEGEKIIFKVINYNLSIENGKKSSRKYVFISNKKNLIVYDSGGYLNDAKTYSLNIKSISYDNIQNLYNFNLSLNRNLDISLYINNSDLNMMALYMDLKDIKFIAFNDGRSLNRKSKENYYDNLLSGNEDLKGFLDIEYKKINEILGIEVSFGECLAIEVIIALIYSRKMDSLGYIDFSKEINETLKWYAIGLLKAIELSDLIEKIILKYEVLSYEEFSATYRLFKEKYKWIKKHNISKNSYIYRLILFSKLKGEEELYKYLISYYLVNVEKENFHEKYLDLNIIINGLETNEKLRLIDIYKDNTNLFSSNINEFINRRDIYEGKRWV